MADLYVMSDIDMNDFTDEEMNDVGAIVQQEQEENAAMIAAGEVYDDPLLPEAMDVEALPSQIGGGVEGHFEFRPDSFIERTSARMGVSERHFNVHVVQHGTFSTHHHLVTALTAGLHNAILQLIDQHRLPLDHRLYINFSSHRLSRAYNYRGATVQDWLNNDTRANALIDHLTSILNSNESFVMDDTFQLSFTLVQPPSRGTGHKRKLKPGYRSSRRFAAFKQSIITIQNDDDLCCARAIVVAKAHVHKDDSARAKTRWNSIRQGRCRIQREEACLLHHEAHVPRGPCGPDELHAFSLAPSLYDYQLMVVDASRGYKLFVYGPSSTKKLVLFYHDNHYDVITKLPGFFARSYICAYCFNPYDNEGRHACKRNQNRCTACLQQGCQDYLEQQRHPGPTLVSCKKCRRTFYGVNCLQNHRTHTYAGRPTTLPRTTVCTTRVRCPTCRKLLKTPKEQTTHRCGYIDCPSCKEYVDSMEHRCFIQIAKSPEEERRKKRTNKHKRLRRGAAAGLATLRANEGTASTADDDDDEDKLPLHVFFDIEAMQDTGTHVPNLVVAETEEDDVPHLFPGTTCLRDFVEWLDTLTEDDTRALIVLAHNFQGYDGYFIVDEYHRQSRIVSQIRNGAKLLQVKHGNITFIDSLSFFPMPLSAFPKTFGLTELKKGFFPHLFNTPDHQTYVGELPEKKDFMPDTMSKDKKKEFDTWYAQQPSHGYDFRQELVAYCTSDVKLLKEGCLKFKDVFVPHAKFNPFSHMAIASACNRDLRQNRMLPHTIANEPVRGWRLNTQQSSVALEWLHWIAREQDIPIRHAGNEGEYRIPEHPKYTVDGYHAPTRTVYEFHGCFWHGCPSCYQHNRTEPRLRLDHRCFADVYESTQDKMRFLKKHNYTVVTMWECTWNQLKQDRPDVAAYVRDELHLSSPLDPRDAFYGGRTNAIKLYHKVDVSKGETIRYYDFTSLYPWVNKNGKYPIGHPEFYSSPPTTDISQYFGLAKCTVLPPPHLYHPVLPYRHAGKLTFPLCASCVQEEMDKPFLQRSHHCHHTPTQRQLTGTWCTPELEKAVEMGYTIVTLHEVWHFPNHRNDLFREYVDMWLRLKEQASGWPAHVGDDPAKRQAHIDAYQNREGITLEPSQIEKNPGLRTLAKLMLNSMWGKFGQRTNKTQVKEFDNPNDLNTFLESDTYDISSVGLGATKDIVEVKYTMQDEDEPISPNLNIFIACFTTCWARLKLYNEALQPLNDRVLYMDTDSVIFLSYPNLSDPPLGDYLGDFKDELPGDHIIEFVSGGPKNYAYQTYKGKGDCKVRGITLNNHGSTFVNFDVLRQNVRDDLRSPLPSGEARHVNVPVPYKITRDASEYTLHTDTDQSKIYRVVFNKRVVDRGTFTTFPYGYTPV